MSKNKGKRETDTTSGKFATYMQGFRKLVGKHSPKIKVLQRNTINKQNLVDNLYIFIVPNVSFIF